MRVRVELLVRGICCLKPGVENYTDNIRVVSIVGRFLEHSRLYIFSQKENCKVYIASADFMTRNIVKRVEVATPILDKKICERIVTMFDLQFEDDEKGKEQDATGEYFDRTLHMEKSIHRKNYMNSPINRQRISYDNLFSYLSTLLSIKTKNQV